MYSNQILVFSLLTLLMMPPPPFLNIIFFYIKPLLGQNIGVLVISTIGLHNRLHENNSLSPCLVLHTGCMILTFVIPYCFYLGIKKTEYQMIDTVLLVVLLNI